MEDKKQDKKQDKDLELKDKKIEEEQMDDVVGGGSSTDKPRPSRPYPHRCSD